MTVSSELPSRKAPIDVEIDFPAVLAEAKLPGVLDPSSIEVFNVTTKRVQPHALSQHFRHGNRGRVRWLAAETNHRNFEVHFKTTERRSILPPRSPTPLIGVGDLLRYNAGEPRPIGPFWPSRLVDLTGDGIPDLTGHEMYTMEPNWPEERVPQGWGNVYCVPGHREGGNLTFGDPIRLRYQEREDGPYRLFEAGYMCADFGDFNRDGLADIAYVVSEKSFEPSKIPGVYKYVHLFLNSGRRDEADMPIFMASGRFPVPPQTPEVPHHGGISVRIEDLDNDGALDLIVGRLFSLSDTTAYYIRNLNPKGWPFQPASPQKFESGKRASYYDVDGDGVLDSICFVTDERTERRFLFDRVAWRRGRGGLPPQFGPPQILEAITAHTPNLIGTTLGGQPRGLLVSGGRGDHITYYEQTSFSRKPSFREQVLSSIAAPLRLGDQATPFLCDWDDDGDLDLLTGGGLGLVNIVLNHGTKEAPIWSEPQPVLAEGKPIEVHMSNVFPGLQDYPDDLGYVHPNYVDWDADGLPDLMLPNLSNRIVWHRNVGTRAKPKFGARQTIECDGFPENRETLAATAKMLGAGTRDWKIRFSDPHSAFHWRSRAGFGDYNGDGLMDFITADGQAPLTPNRFSKHSSLFVQYRDAQGKLRLRKEGLIMLPDGNPMLNAPGTAAQLISADWDGDGLLDLIINDGATLNTAPAVLRNIGTKQKPRFDFPRRLACFGQVMGGMVKHGPYYGIGDLDGDGGADLLASTETGTYLFFRRTALEMKAPPKIQLGRVALQGSSALTSNARLPRVFIVGDSISIGYGATVRAQLASRATVQRPKENCRESAYGLTRLDEWLGAEKWDVIHFNFGLHDLKFLDASGQRVAPEKGRRVSTESEYEANLRAIVRRLQRTGARLIFATTTPIPAGAGTWIERDETRFNEIAARVMKENGVAIDDLHRLAMSDLGKLQRPADVHFTDHGSAVLGKQVAASIEAALGK